jgi:ATP-dependent phosphofructokinase / diphosphate-dependent phosphofructokinase
MINRLGILVGGGPAPGTNGVISAITIEALKIGCTPIGFHDGFEWLAQRYTDEQHHLTIEEVSRAHLDGGVILGTSRTDITRDPQSLQNTIAALKKLGIEALVTIGGDDVIRSSLAVERESQGSIKVVQVPKSIDNDLMLPLSIATLGFETARHFGVDLIKRLMEDARTTARWYLAVTMGRPSGNLTLGIGKAASATCTIIPEEFHKKTISLSEIVDIVEGSIIKRRAMGRPFGVVLLAEALVEHFDPKEIAELQNVDRDAQGNIRVTEIDLGRMVKNELQHRLERRKIKVTLVDKTIGYELRCAPPIPYDAEYARDLGYAAVRYLAGGGSGAMITIQGGELQAVPLSEMIDANTGRGRQRPVDVDTESYQVARDYMVRIGKKDLADEAWVEKLAEAGGLSKTDFLARFGRLAS